MASLPEFNNAGDLPPGVYQATLDEVVARFRHGSVPRRLIAERLRRVYQIAANTGHVARFIVFGSFITAHPAPNDVDVFLLMDDDFDAGQLRGEAAILFNHVSAQAFFGASVFWLRRLAALGGDEAAIEHWQIKRDRTRRGVVEVTTA